MNMPMVCVCSRRSVYCVRHLSCKCNRHVHNYVCIRFMNAIHNFLRIISIFLYKIQAKDFIFHFCLVLVSKKYIHSSSSVVLLHLFKIKRFFFSFRFLFLHSFTFFTEKTRKQPTQKLNSLTG